MNVTLAVLLSIFSVVLTVVAGLLALIYREQRTRMDHHEQLDEDRFKAIEAQAQKRHDDNINEFRRSSKAQNRMSGALILALSTNTSPDERRDMIKILMEAD